MMTISLVRVFHDDGPRWAMFDAKNAIWAGKGRTRSATIAAWRSRYGKIGEVVEYKSPMSKSEAAAMAASASASDCPSRSTNRRRIAGQDQNIKLNHELEAFRGPGGLFDVEPCEMDANIGRRCIFIAPTCTAEQDNYTVATVQKNCRGEVCYRVVGDDDKHNFGRLASPNELKFTDGGEQ